MRKVHAQFWLSRHQGFRAAAGALEKESFHTFPYVDPSLFSHAHAHTVLG